ncbi:MAG: hypothetical protein WB767_00470 [Nocardioides sp.]
MEPRPTSVTRAVQVVWLLVALALAFTVLAVVFDDDLVAAWGGQGVSVDDTRVPPSFTPVVIVLYVVVASLVLVLMALFRDGNNWARHCLAIGFVLIAIATLAGVRTEPPTLFVVCSLVALALVVLLLVLLYLPTTRAYVTAPVRHETSEVTPEI